MRLAFIAVLVMARPAAAQQACVKDDRGAVAERQQAEAENEKRFAQELASQKLVLVTPTLLSWPRHEMPRDPRSSAWKAGTVTKRKHDDEIVQVLVAPDSATEGCYTGNPHWEFVKDGKKLYRVERVPQSRSNKSFTLCSCAPARCGGMNPQIFEVGYEIPKGLTFAGTKQITYPTDDVRLNYIGKCQPPP